MAAILVNGCLDEQLQFQWAFVSPGGQKKKQAWDFIHPYPGMSLRFCCLLGTDQGPLAELQET